MISYEPLISYLESNGYTVNELKKQKIINATTAQQIRNGDPVSLRIIDRICQYLNLSIEQVVRFEKDEK